MIFVADKIPPELRRIVEFLNEQMDPAEVLAVEIKQYIGQNLKTLVPRVIGQTAEAEQKKSGGSAQKRKWDEATFFEELTKRGIEEVIVGKRILEWARPVANRIWWGEGTKHSSFVPVLNSAGRDHQLFAVWTNGYVEIYFQWYQYKPPFDSEEKRLELLNRLNSIKGISISEQAITKRPGIPLSTFKDKPAMEAFLSTLEWIISEIKGWDSK